MKSVLVLTIGEVGLIPKFSSCTLKRYVTVNHKRFLTFLISTFNFLKQTFAEKSALCPDFLQLTYLGVDIF